MGARGTFSFDTLGEPHEMPELLKPKVAGIYHAAVHAVMLMNV